MHRFTANSWIELATARASLVECEFTSLEVPLTDLSLTNCETNESTTLGTELSFEKPTVVVLLRHFA